MAEMRGCEKDVDVLKNSNLLQTISPSLINQTEPTEPGSHSNLFTTHQTYFLTCQKEETGKICSRQRKRVTLPKLAIT
jgi:invasion protein IalB